MFPGWSSSKKERGLETAILRAATTREKLPPSPPEVWFEPMNAVEKKSLLGARYSLAGYAIAAASVLVAAGFVAVFSSLLPAGVSLVAKPHRFPGGEERAVEHAQTRSREEMRLRFAQGVQMLQVGEFEHAITAFHRVLAIEPQLPEAHLNMGFAFFELKNYAAAERFFLGTQALRPDMAAAFYGLAISRAARNDDELAIKDIERFLSMTSDADAFHAKALRLKQDMERKLGKADRQHGSKKDKGVLTK